ncbi:MAG: tetratricopeptide repeat protein [Candidatus Eiseniibacteriota bacterium]
MSWAGRMRSGAVLARGVAAFGRGTAVLARAAAVLLCALAAFGSPHRGMAAPIVPDPSPIDVYKAIIRASSANSPSDTLGNGAYAAAKEAFYAGDFDVAAARAQAFIASNTRNLSMSDALEITLLVRNFRDFQDQPLKGYAGVLALREAGRPDSATVLAQTTLGRWPGARVRYHLHYQLAALAAERGDHATAVTQALVVADTSSMSRLAPAALKLAGDESIGMGQGSDRALKLYQELLERYPDSPLAPEVRAQVLEMRKKLQL